MRRRTLRTLWIVAAGVALEGLVIATGIRLASYIGDYMPLFVALAVAVPASLYYLHRKMEDRQTLQEAARQLGLDLAAKPPSLGRVFGEVMGGGPSEGMTPIMSGRKNRLELRPRRTAADRL
jgi:hypothetical protein